MPSLRLIKNERLELHHLFVLIACIYLIFSNISIISAFVFLISALFFYISFIVGKKLYSKFSTLPNFNEKKHYTFGLILMIIGLIFIIADLLWVRDVPLFDPLSRRFLSVYFTTFSHLFLLGWAIVIASTNIERKKVIVYTAVFAVLIMLLGYRTNVLVLLISSIIVLYYKGDISNRELFKYGIGVFAVLIFLSALRLYVLGVGGNPITSRIELTMSVYDIIFNNFNGIFNGYIHYSAVFSYLGMCSGARTVIAHILGIYGVSITPTIVGAVVGDYGTLAVIPYFGILGIFLGFFYKLSERLKGIYLGVYGILFAYTLIAIESGILDLDVIIYYLFGMLLCIYALISGKLKNLKGF
ncbi:MAG: oligosaccharide repeat unit polymerase [Methanococci archaeon]|nr:oligosaccharide repeat unit polymerase [Methanococci archaeon]